ncbi:TIGR02452 family protein [Streptomyces sp. DSM 44917]|uniref:TIGR02452 family protein n=1 Tax=Streptomyces boetiae TaxID=3075541 RepID=A0ABU2LBR7_9ACTN|nr:TIGR02452 family protein [Streptomyces sp. DSM 44917]MDT0309009.1 TIGR02452 family protein [Streptomyces sp. DSM 44917]
MSGSESMRRWFDETRAAFERGWYDHDGRRVELGDPLREMREGTRLYAPEELAGLPAPAGGSGGPVEVTGESTLVAARRLAGAGAGHVAALNFASARNPGGGVVRGTVAQEEDLARAGALYDALARCPEFYAFHRAQGDPFYSDRVIWSPGVPVYRDEEGGWLPAPVPVSFLTSAAPNRRVIERERPGETGLLPGVFARRARGVLAVAARHGVTHLVLGAWGCGVFGNEPADVAGQFAGLLGAGGEFAGAFRQVTFAVLDPAGRTRRAFERALTA